MMDEQIQILDKKDYFSLIKVWEASVRETHDFLEEEEILFYKKAILEYYFDNVKLYGIKESVSEIKAFIGLSDNQVEMLFVHPNYHRQSFGTQLIHFALNRMHVYNVGVNEENKKALKFYFHLGYKIVGRDDVDAEGKNHPILHLWYYDRYE